MIIQIRKLLEAEEAKITALQSERNRKQEEAAAQEAAAANQKLLEESKLAVEAATAELTRAQKALDRFNTKIVDLTGEEKDAMQEKIDNA